MKRIIDAVPVRGPGMYRHTLETGTAPPWIRNNLAAIEAIERKMYNQHRFGENLRLAFTFPRIQP
jgi:hypothetical protein